VRDKHCWSGTSGLVKSFRNSTSRTRSHTHCRSIWLTAKL